MKSQRDAIHIKFNISNRMQNSSLGPALWRATIQQIECPEKSKFSIYNELLGNDYTFHCQ